MKRYVITVFLPLLLLGCSDDMSESSQDTRKGLTISERSIYENSFSERKKRNQEALELLQDESTRSYDSKSDLYGYLFSLDKSELDSLCNIYCTPEIEAMRDSVFNVVWSELEELTSEESCDYLLDCIEEYIETNGHNMDMLAEMVEGQPEIIRKILLRAAGEIDETFDAVAPYVTQTRANAVPCLVYAYTSDLTGSIIENAIKEIGDLIGDLTGDELISILVDAGVDTYAAIEFVRKYKECQENLIH